MTAPLGVAIFAMFAFAVLSFVVGYSLGESVGWKRGVNDLRDGIDRTASVNRRQREHNEATKSRSEP